MKTRKPQETTALLAQDDIRINMLPSAANNNVVTGLASLPPDVIGVIASHLSLVDVSHLSLVNKKLNATIKKLNQRIRFTSDEMKMPFMYEDDAMSKPATYQYIFEKLNENARDLKRAKKLNYALLFKILHYGSIAYGTVAAFGGPFAMLATFLTAGIIPGLGVTAATSASGLGAFSLYSYARNKEATWRYKAAAMENISRDPDLIINRKDEMAVEVVVEDPETNNDYDYSSYHY